MSTKRTAPTANGVPTVTPSSASGIPVITLRQPSAAPKLPTVLKFPLVVVIASSVLILANTALVEVTGPKLFPVARNLSHDWQTAVVAGWKVLELGVAWFSGFDGIDMFCFSLLTHLPHAFLLRNFYLVERTPLYVFLLSESVASALPFYLLRRRNAHHRNSKTASEHHPAPPLATDRSTFTLITLVASAMYSIPVVLSLITWLPVHLASNFYGLRTLDPAHSATLLDTLLASIPTGLAAADFLFNATASYSATIPVHASTQETTQDGHVSKESTILEFDPNTATLVQTLHRNVFWHAYLPARTQELLKRASVLVLWTLANTTFLAVAEVEGTELLGSVGWASVWAGGAAAASAMLGWIAGVAV